MQASYQHDICIECRFAVAMWKLSIPSFLNLVWHGSIHRQHKTFEVYWPKTKLVFYLYICSRQLQQKNSPRAEGWQLNDAYLCLSLPHPVSRIQEQVMVHQKTTTEDWVTTVGDVFENSVEKKSIYILFRNCRSRCLSQINKWIILSMKKKYFRVVLQIQSYDVFCMH